jgi:hypothetical protein
MSRFASRLSLVVALLAFAAPAFAAEEKAASSGPSHVGVGIGVTTDFGTDIYVPMDLGAFKLEPSLGIARVSLDNGGGSSSSFNLGCGFLFPLRSTKTVNVYAGGRIFLDFVSADGGGGIGSDSGVDFALAGVAGAEWFADPHFSIGAEARLGFTVATTLSSGGVTLRNGYNAFGTSGVALLRYYF